MNRFTPYILRSADDPLFDKAHHIYTISFPPHEQRTLQGIIDKLHHPDFRYTLFLDDDNRVAGIRNAWHRPKFVYLEHFAVSPDFRNSGIGKLLLDDLTGADPGRVILEIDPVVDDISRRRLNFYLRNGFVANEQYNYIHPPYKEGDSPYPLLIMSHLRPLPRDLYRQFEDYHHTYLV